jgi:hypothetical protein
MWLPNNLFDERENEIDFYGLSSRFYAWMFELLTKTHRVSRASKTLIN